MKEVKAGEIVKHMLDGYGIGIVLVPPRNAGKKGDGKKHGKATYDGMQLGKGKDPSFIPWCMLFDRDGQCRFGKSCRYLQTRDRS